MTIISEHACPSLVELGLSCQRVQFDEFQKSTGESQMVEIVPLTTRQWRLHLVAAGKRSLLSLIIIFCPFCGERLEEVNKLPSTGAVLS